MRKINYQTVYGIKIYSIDYLCNHELSETELNNLLDNNGKGLLYSLIIGMFKMIKSPKRNYQIIKMIRDDKGWMNKINWTKSQCDQYENMINKVYYNVYRFKGDQAKSLAQWFIIQYGLNVNGNSIDLTK